MSFSPAKDLWVSPSNPHMARWLNPAICERYGVADSADAAWESNGGGKFTFKIDRSGDNSA